MKQYQVKLEKKSIPDSMKIEFVINTETEFFYLFGVCFGFAFELEDSKEKCLLILHKYLTLFDKNEQKEKLRH